MAEVDRTSHSYLLGVAEYERDKYKAELANAVEASPDRLIETLRNCLDDPMWAEHVEMPKQLLRSAIDRTCRDGMRLKLYRDIFAEITAKAVQICDPASDDPERVRHYQIPVGPVHRAAGKLGFQLFNGEQHLADAVKEIARLNAALAQAQQPGEDKRAAVIEECANIALAIDSGRGNEKEIAKAIRALALRSERSGGRGA